MPDRTAKFIFASVLAGVALSGLSLEAARAADDCLLAPKAETPAGSHWYYRIEHATNRHCWYLRAEGEAPAPTAATAAPNSSASATPVAPIAAAPMQRSVANAHAEWPPQTSIEPPRRNAAVAPAMPADPAPAPIRDDNATAPEAAAPQSVVASRWLDPSAVNSTISPQPAPSQMAANQVAANVQPEPQPDSSQSDSPQSDATAAPPPAAAAVPLATADSSQGMPASLPMLLAVMTGALMLAGLTASLVLKFGGARRGSGGRNRRDGIWDSVERDGIRPPPHPSANVVPRRPHFPRDLDQPDESTDRVVEFYAKLSKQARR